MKASGNTILITGGGSGIGLALAESFIRAGNEVIICGRTQAKLDAAMRRLPALQSFTCDVSSESDRGALSRVVREHFPRFNVLINNAAVAEITDLTLPGAADRVASELAIDLQAPVLLTMQFIPHLLKQAQAAVVNVTTAVAGLPASQYPAYSAAKAGLRSFSKSLRHQLENTSVSVFEVLPAAVDTRLNREDVTKISPAEAAGQVLRGMRMSVPEIYIGPPRKRNTIARLFPRTAL